MTANLLLSNFSAGCVFWEASPGLGLNNLFPFPLIGRGGKKIKICPIKRILSLGLAFKHIDHVKKLIKNALQ